MRVEDTERLWRGSAVRWIGAATRVGGIDVRYGDQGTVVEAGAYGLRSIGELSRGGARRTGRSKVAVLLNGQVVEVRRGDLEVVPAEHRLRPEPDAEHAAWLREDLYVDPGRRARDRSVGLLVPGGYDAIAQVLHPFTDRDGGLHRWSDVAQRAPVLRGDPFDVRGLHLVARAADLHEPHAGQFPRELGDAVLEALEPATTTPDDVVVAVWDGWGDVPAARWPGAAPVDHGWRSYLLLRGPLAAARDPVGIGPLSTRGGQLWWPIDRAWIVVTEIDDPWTYIAGASSLISSLLEHPLLESVHVDLAARHAPVLQTPAGVEERGIS